MTDIASDSDTVILRNSVNPLSLLEQVDQVYFVSSQLGFEALLAGKPVHCFGLPWYAGWGITQDRIEFVSSLAKLPPEQLSGTDRFFR